VIERREDQHVHVRKVGSPGDPAGRVQPVDAWHADVHQDDVGVGLLCQVNGSGTVGGLAHHNHPWLGVDEGPEPGADQRLVLGDENPDRLGHAPPPGDAGGRRSLPVLGRQGGGWQVIGGRMSSSWLVWGG
jgi:hypothetical protein